MNARRRSIVVLLAALVVAAITSALGSWQLGRAAQKEATQAQALARGAQPALDNAAFAQVSDKTQLLLRHAVLQGTWLPDHTVYLDNRTMDERVGYYVLTPLRLQGDAGVVVVQRGWVPRNFQDRTALPALDTPSGLVQLSATIAPPPSKLFELGTPSAGVIRQNLELTQFSQEIGLPLLPITLRQTDAANDGLLRHWPAANLGIEKHYGYAAQWFAMAVLALVLYGWFQIYKPYLLRRKKAKPYA